MAKQPGNPSPNTGRRPQLNLEVTEEEKNDFEKLARIRGMKLATLVRQLLNAEAQRWAVPAYLSDYRNNQPDALYQYQVNASESSETKLGILRQFLQLFKSDCDFSFTTFEANHHVGSVICVAYSSSGESINKLWLGLAPEREKNYREHQAMDAVWQEVLGLSLLLKDKWNGVNYTVEARRTLKGKKILLQQFVEKYRGATFSTNAFYNGKQVFKVIADGEGVQEELLIEYLPARVGEATELLEALGEYQKQAVPQ